MIKLLHVTRDEKEFYREIVYMCFFILRGCMYVYLV